MRDSSDRVELSILASEFLPRPRQKNNYNDFEGQLQTRYLTGHFDHMYVFSTCTADSSQGSL